MVATSVDNLHSASVNITKQTALTEKGEVVSGRGDQVNMHDILTGSDPQGNYSTAGGDTTCGNWTKSGDGSAIVGHHDRAGLKDTRHMNSWNSSHGSRGCSQDATEVVRRRRDALLLPDQLSPAANTRSRRRGDRMKRRAFITLLGGAAAAWPIAVRAQQPERVRRVGVLLPAAADNSQFQTWVGAFLQALALLGWSIGRNLRIDTRWATANAETIRSHAAELSALVPDVTTQHKSAGHVTCGMR